MHTRYVAVREGLLALLERGPCHGYRLKRVFDAATGGAWRLNIGQVYTTLNRLERDGLVTASGEPGERIYRLTRQGRAEVGSWWEANAGADLLPRDELMVKVLLAIEMGSEQGLAVITRQRGAVMALLQRRRQERPAAHEDDMAAALVHDAVVVRAEADLRWLDLCEERLLAAVKKGKSR